MSGRSEELKIKRKMFIDMTTLPRVTGTIEMLDLEPPIVIFFFEF